MVTNMLLQSGCGAVVELFQILLTVAQFLESFQVSNSLLESIQVFSSGVTELPLETAFLGVNFVTGNFLLLA